MVVFFSVIRMAKNKRNRNKENIERSSKLVKEIKSGKNLPTERLIRLCKYFRQEKGPSLGTTSLYFPNRRKEAGKVGRKCNIVLKKLKLFEMAYFYQELDVIKDSAIFGVRKGQPGIFYSPMDIKY